MSPRRTVLSVLGALALGAAAPARAAAPPAAAPAGIDGTGRRDAAPALEAACRAAVPWQAIHVPAGQLRLGRPIACPHPVLWQIDGTTRAGSDDPLITLPGTVETFFNGTKYFGQIDPPPNTQPVVRIDLLRNRPGGSVGLVDAGLKINAHLGRQAIDSPWAVAVGLTSEAEDCTLARRCADGRHFPQPVGFSATVIKKGSAPVWAGGFSLQDTQHLPSSAGGGLLGLELGINVGGADDAVGGQGARKFIDMIAATDAGAAEAHVGYGLHLRTYDTHATIDKGLVEEGNFGTGVVLAGNYAGAALDTSAARLGPAPALRLAAGQCIAMERGGEFRVCFDGDARTYRFYNGSKVLMALDAAGNLRLAGRLEQNAAP